MMVNKTIVYSLMQESGYTALCVLNDTLRVFHANPSQFLDKHLWDFSFGAVLTSLYYTLRPQDTESKFGQIASVAAPTAMLSAYELASKSPHIIGSYDPKDILAYALGSIAAYVGVKLFVRINRVKTDGSLNENMDINKKSSGTMNLESRVRGHNI